MGLGLFGAALLYGDGVITPAISVLGAVEGIAVAAPQLPAWVVPILSSIILVALFMFQRRGTAKVGAVFGRVMVVWFTAIAVLGVHGIMRHPEVLAAVNPWHAIAFFVRDGLRGFLILGAVVLVVTGGEALYADMGHFGKRPIRLAWFAVVLPALVLNYFGQGALLLDHPEAARNPFYSLVPGWALYPMVAVATAAAVVASQALISGAFSLTRQAVQLGYSPRVTIRHTSQDRDRPDLPPGVNRLLGVGLRAPGADVPVVRQPGVGLRHRGHRHDDDHDLAVLLGGAGPVALAPLARGGDRRPVPDAWTWRSSAPTWSRSRAAAGSRWSSPSGSIC